MSLTQCQKLKAPSFFKYVWLFSGHQALKGYVLLTSISISNLLTAYGVISFNDKLFDTWDGKMDGWKEIFKSRHFKWKSVGIHYLLLEQDQNV